ncbi:hypothetical protein ACOSQ2_030040 [Xanthoceras sorbifolium]
MFWPAARSSNAVDFEIAMGKIRETSVPAYDYLMQIPKHQWSVHEFDQECKSDHNTNNVVEAFNGWLNEHLWPNVEFATVLPPLKRRRPGRPKLQRRRGLNEPQKVPRSSSLKCSICHEVGHNSRTCKKKNDGQSGGNQGTTTSSTPSTSTATNRRRMEVSFFLLYLTPTNRNAKTNIF